MALVEPLVGHLLSKYKETVLEGLSKIRHTLQVGGEQANELAVAVSQREEALQALRATLLRHEYFVPTLQTLTVVLTQLVERGNRVALAREVLRGDCAALFRKTLATLSDATLTHVTAALQFLTVAVKDAPLLVLARLRSPADAHVTPAAASAASMSPLAAVATQRRADVPLHLAAFRLQLTYNQRRVRLTRLGFLVQLVTSPMHNAVVDTICSHGVLTHLLEDAAELLREGTSAGVACALSALRVVRELFVQSRHITAEQKRRVLLAQRNVFRLLVRALEFDHVADNAAAILYAIVDETIESPADYASTRVESLEDQGMPNYLLFFLLRQLRPKASERMSQLVLHILQRAPDLIRPYFTRVSGHLAEEGSSHGVASATVRVAVLNLMTRTFLCPMPYHLAAQQVRLEPVVAKTSTFYTMCPRDVADEICPAWVAEYVHRLINGSTNLLMLALAMQLTQAALMRAKRVLPLVLAVQNAAKRNKRTSTAGDAAAGGSAAETVVSLPSPRDFTEADLDVLQGNDTAEAEVWDTYNAQVRHHLQAALPSREEFWHRMTQQLHRTLTASAAAPTSSATSPSSAATDAVLEKTHVVVQRMLLLMKSYVDVFDVRVPWLSAVPIFLPDLARSAVSSTSVARGPMTGKGSNGHATAAAASVHPITAALQKQNDILKPWPAASVALLCELLAVSQQRRVPMMKMHHINMSQTVGIGEWPLLLSILLWVTHHRPHSPPRQESMEAVQEARAMGWAAQLLLWTVHSVTIHSSCTMAEAHLWLSCLTPNTVPVFLHVLNHLLMRSLSKVADRVTHELRDAQHGVLAAAALHFIDRTKEKQQQKGSAGGGEDDGDGEQHAHQQLRRKQKTPRVECANNNGGGSSSNSSSSSSANLWGTHLQASLAEFESVVGRVVHLWERRARLLAQTAVAATAELNVPRVTQQQCIEVLVLADRQRGFAKAPRRCRLTSQSAHLRTFAFTLHSPVLPLPEEEAAVALLSRLSIAVSSASPLDGEVLGRAAKQAPMRTSLVEDVCTALGIEDSLAAKDKAAKAPTPPWFAMSSVCWQVAGVLLSLTHSTASAPSSRSSSATEAAHKLALRLGRALLSDEAAVTAHLRANADREGSLAGLLVLMLACTRTLLQLISLSGAEQRHPCLSVDECAALGRVCLDVYSGTLGVQDRLIYAVCLTLHYLSAARHVAHAATATAATKEERADEAAAEQQGKRQRSAAAKYLSPDYHEGAEVPDALVQRRFLLCGHTASAARTPEVEMLSWHLDTLTEEDMTCMALLASSRLHNAIHLEDGSSADGATDLLGAVFPELRSAGDAHVTDLERLSLSNVLDLRYMVPLLHRVASVSATFSAHLPTGRVIPLLLKALTSIDPQLRSAAVAALSTLYIPKGALRVVVSVARIKLAQMQMSPSTGGAGRRSQQPAQPRRVSSAAAVPRLPTPLAIMLIMSIRPLGRYDDVLHHHLVHFLMHLESVLDTPMPFTRWATTPPLAAISVPLMLERQEALQLRTNKLGGGGKSSGGVTQASAADVAQELRKEIPPQLAFLLQLLRHACEVPQDGAALIESNGLDGLLLLCDMLTASDGQRASYVQCLLILCTQSAALTCLFARAGHVLPWTVSFLWQLCREYGKATPYPYSGQTFTTALELLRVMCAATVQSKISLAEAPALSDAAAEQLKESMRQLRAWVVDAHVTARDVLDVFDDIIGRCSHAAHGQHSGAAEADDTRGTEGGVKAKEAGAVSPASASQPSSPPPLAERRRETPSRCERRTPPKRVRAEGTAEVGVVGGVAASLCRP
ncbi:conserved hypothetical protein [Leishmania major strain Friedlin]|uniref:URB1 N-terminal domain-containing protein n=1 Tax=Leishmania major TaxID=5664 RepID=Q4QAS3_LEIMA|nr:conserved hypothetical protein [Leishmania major strain Friedlin]CAG9574526.1 Ribosome_60S_biogenesis_N-terminal_-_putative [Leishmania major strain Friedlin]CAJ04322.1 conserved hypothetical protein [Leishmania major strain Friedlin]|eukprot:XP_001683575.1 conserved hypothetical protein [Leishmania major strain Friedlin]